MSFLSQTFLFALPLAMVPIALHLINRTQREVVHWGAMQFLTDATTEGRRYQRIEEWLLLACRVGLVVALVVALARPLINSSFFGVAAQRDLVILLDNSLSTNLKLGDSTVYDQLKDRTQRFLDELGSGEQVRVMLTEGDRGWLQAEPIMSGDGRLIELKKRIAQSQPTLARTNIRQALQSAMDAHLDSSDHQLPRSIILITDGRAEGWDPEATVAWQQVVRAMGSQEQRAPTSLQVIFADELPDTVANVTVAEISSQANLIPVGEKVVFQARILNTGDSDQIGIRLFWTINGERYKESTIDRLSPNESRELEWSTRFESDGCFRVGCELDTASVLDQLELDNFDQKIIEATDAIPILFVRNESAYRSSTGHIFFNSALGYGPIPSDDAWRSVFEPETIFVEDIENHSLTDYHSVVLNDPGPLPSHVMEQLTDYVQNGGGLWVALGDRMEIAGFNSIWYDEGTGLCPWQLIAPVTQDEIPSDAHSEQPPLVHQPDQYHPATATLSKTAQVDLDEVQIQQRHAFSRENNLTPITALLETNRGDPLAVENAFGQGRIILQTFPLGSGWSNLPLTRAYVVMIHDWLAYLTQPAATQYNLPPLAPIRLPRLSTDQAQSIVVRPPVGEPVTLADSDRRADFRYGRTQLPGCYQVDVKTNDGTTSHFYQVKKDVNESRLDPLSNEQRSILQSILGPGFDGEPENTEPTTTAARDTPTWHWFLVALLVFVVADQFLASRVNRTRFGAAV